ncbi:MAG TPA: fibronectin type III domain-containing protein [Acidimicrobiia bacterium]|nr:fibronectin type III domain-containing protein [Acidimicrobiia bacterium]
MSGLVLVLDAAPASAGPTTWSAIPSAAVTNDNLLFGVSCVSTSFCAAVGRYSGSVDQTLVELWDGTAWSVALSPNVGTSSNDLTDVSCTSTTFCVAVGWRDDPDTGFHTLIETWDGAHWSVTTSPDADPSYNQLLGVSCATPTFCVAVGESQYDVGSGSNALVEMWNGSTWSVASTAATSTLSGVSCPSTTFCAAGGLVWNGSSWSTASGAGGGRVSCVSSTFCVATYGTDFKTWNGTAWSDMSGPTISATYNALTGISCVSETVCAAVGRAGDGTTTSAVAEVWDGSSWSIMPTPTVGEVYNAAAAVSCPSTDLCLAVGSWGDISSPDQALVLSGSPTGRPWPPNIGSAVPGNGRITVAFSASNDGGSPILGFTARCALLNGSGSASANGTASPIVVTGLTNGFPYKCTVSAMNAIGIGVQSHKSHTATPATIPTAPRSPSALPGNASATVKWTVPASNGGSTINGYVITPYLAGAAQPARTFNSTSTTEIVTGLTNLKWYSFQVQARNAWGLSAKSVATAAIVVGLPTAPTKVRAVGGDRRATVSWTAPASNGGFAITAYVVTPYVGSTAQPKRVFNSTATTQVITGLTNGTTYTFKVAARTANGTGLRSVATTPVTVGAPLAPTAVTATAGPQRATVHWTAPANNGSAITGYVITPYKAGVAQAPRNFASNATTQVVTGLTSGASYTFKVAAENARGTGPQSAASNAVVPT